MLHEDVRAMIEREERRVMAREMIRLQEKRRVEALRAEARMRERMERARLSKGRKKDLPSCGAKTRAGGECRMRVVLGKKRCRLHGGLSTGARTPEGIARIREAQAKRWARQRAERQLDEIGAAVRDPCSSVGDDTASDAFDHLGAAFNSLARA